MADAAAFFAKKKKKKAFKFNANKIDASQVISTVHVDAPAVSSAVDNSVSTLSSTTIKNDKVQRDDKATEGGDWDDVALAAKFQKSVSTVTTTSSGGAAELLDMKALEKKRNEQDDIAERLRVEDTKAALAAAREGMEKEGQRLKEEKEAKLQTRPDGTASRFGAASANILGSSAGGSGGKWVPPHLRGVQRKSVTPSSGYQRKVDTQDENLFPDLATADKIIAKEEEQRQQANRKTRVPAPGWGMKKPHPTLLNSQTYVQVKDEKSEEPQPVVERVEKKIEHKATTKPATSTPSAPIATGLKKKTKRKKKDLSTFKA